MSTNCYIMVCSRKTIIDKFEAKSIFYKKEGAFVEETILPVFAGSFLRDFMQTLGDDKGIPYRKEYLINPPDLTRQGLTNQYEINPYFIDASYLEQELLKLVNTPVEKTEQNAEYYDELVEDRICKIDFIGRLLGAINCFDPSFCSDRYLIYWFE